ncbi:hypothetical protein A1O3_03541 [Capronia epimyces CBS 606.96]|uniref:Uncharacterized protein n=1 Tax=Capronia epimyces CBS 606.96 TaxID=1182542 RepID=W9Y265_9EURO|nr:uncharacterized protein A1O3_03541 [Capronia epimyces CBS 606.96]EXJ86588.1 hypothetical protein A1O3_03541 [Capronia epimyces CBS 606.96]
MRNDSHQSRRSRSHSRSRNGDKDKSKPKSEHLEQSLAFRNPTTSPSGAAATDHGDRPSPSRSRSSSRLQKRPSARSLKTSASTPAMAYASPATHGKQIDQQRLTALPQLSEQAIPHRSSSLRKKPRPQTADRPLSNQGYLHPENDRRIASAPNGILSIRPKPAVSDVAPNSGLRGGSTTSSSSSSFSSSPSTSSTSPGQAPATPRQRTPRHLPLAPNDPSPLNPLYHIPSPRTSSQRNTMPADAANPPAEPTTSRSNMHTLLPPGFRPGTSEHTDVEETMHPAVTHEVVINRTKEIVQENITRDIHVDHYYTYVQPIKAVEVLPARHFVIDDKTGQKVEIPAPEGWEMPVSLQPSKPDLSGLAPVSRHYRVDEQHPEGVPELPPAGNKAKSPQELRWIARASHTAKWSPFPKVS